MKPTKNGKILDTPKGVDNMNNSYNGINIKQRKIIKFLQYIFQRFQVILN